MAAEKVRKDGSLKKKPDFWRRSSVAKEKGGILLIDGVRLGVRREEESVRHRGVVFGF